MTASRFDLTGQVVVVTGGAKGLGKIYAQEFARAGALVVASDIDGAGAEAVAQGIVAEGGNAIGSHTDISDPASVDRMVEAARKSFGTIDVLINNASLMSALPRRSWLEIPVEEWDRVMAVNLRGMFLCCKAVFPLMRAKGRGKIVNISSSRSLGRHAAAAALHDVQSGRHRPDTRACARGRRLWRYGQCRVTRQHPERDAGRQFGSEIPRRTHRRPRNSARSGAGRPGRRRDVLGFARQRLHDRPDYQCRWRPGDALIWPNRDVQADRDKHVVDVCQFQMMCVTINPIITIAGTPSNQRRTGMSTSKLIDPLGSPATNRMIEQ